MKATEFREKYNNDLIFREQIKTKAKARYHNDPNYKEKTITNAKNRYLRLKDN